MAQVMTSASRIHEGDVIIANNENIGKVAKIEFCPGKPEAIHLNHHCFDMRFTNFRRIES